MTPHLSVVMPVWNAAETVAAAVASVRAQTLAPWELIVVDDGSDDATADAVEQASVGDARIRLLRRGHAGIVAALSAGLSDARAPLIARMDADDVMHPDRLAAQIALLDARPEVGVASCRVEFGGDRAASRGYAVHVDWINSLVEPDEIARARFVESPIAHPSVMFRREVIDRHGGYAEGPFPEDFELWLRWMDAGVRFAKVPAVLLRWNDPPARLSRTDPRYGEGAFYACKCRYLARWLSAHVVPTRAILLWGAGRITRRRFAALAAHGVRLAGYIDIDARKIGTLVAGLPVLAPRDIPPREGCFVVGGVGVRGARDLHRATLVSRGFVEGADFIFAA
ncbi:MAG: glycosyltransferase [Opitutaceae bacterium]|nr:glycosyltransferase [Opitutaceae bacterium]